MVNISCGNVEILYNLKANEVERRAKAMLLTHHLPTSPSPSRWRRTKNLKVLLLRLMMINVVSSIFNELVVDGDPTTLSVTLGGRMNKYKNKNEYKISMKWLTVF